MGKFSRRVTVTVLAGAAMLSVQGPVVAATPVVRTTGGVLPFDRDWPVQPGPSAVRFKRDGSVAARLELRTHRHRPISPAQLTSGPPSALTLSTRDTARFVEPPGYGTDDNGKSYTDANYWNFCVAGAAAVATSYFLSDPVELSGAFHEPYGPFSVTTRWDPADVDSNLGFVSKGRAYMLYMAMQVKPPSFDRPGIDDFSTYPTLGGSLQAIRDAVNWEISSHLRGGGWDTWFYFTQANSGSTFSAAQLNADIAGDIVGTGAPVIVAVDADYLPNWPDLAKPLHHAISIVGYDNDRDTYTYLDTCGRQCGTTSNGGTHEISQAKLFKAVQMVGRPDGDGYLIKRADGTPKYPTGGYVW